MSTVTLPILHFNDVYRVAEQKLSNVGTIDVTQFASVLDDLRAKWPTRPDGKKDGLVLFSGDLFAPSVESSVTRGSHMVSSHTIFLRLRACELVVLVLMQLGLLGTGFKLPRSRCLSNRFVFAAIHEDHANRESLPGNHDFDFGTMEFTR
jgi:hypothetical protein